MKKHVICIILSGICILGSAQQHPGYRVQGRYLYDNQGERVVLVGVNKMICWTDIDGIPSYEEIAKTGANCVRIVWSISNSAQQLGTAIYNCRIQNMIPIRESWPLSRFFKEKRKKKIKFIYFRVKPRQRQKQSVFSGPSSLPQQN